MINKTDKHQYFFEVSMKHTDGRRGELTAKNVKTTIQVVTAPAFKGGMPDIWTPEHLFLGALISGYVTTYLAIAEKRELPVKDITCEAIGQINLFDNHLEFTAINLYPTVCIESDTNLNLANEILLSAYVQCITANSVKALLINHGEVVVQKVVAAKGI